jgi:hypothetical protein
MKERRTKERQQTSADQDRDPHRQRRRRDELDLARHIRVRAEYLDLAEGIFGAKPRIRRSMAMLPPARTPMPIVCSVRIAGKTKTVGVSRMKVLNAPFSMKARKESMRSRQCCSNRAGPC